MGYEAQTFCFMKFDEALDSAGRDTGYRKSAKNVGRWRFGLLTSIQDSMITVGITTLFGLLFLFLEWQNAEQRRTKHDRREPKEVLQNSNQVQQYT